MRQPTTLLGLAAAAVVLLGVLPQASGHGHGDHADIVGGSVMANSSSSSRPTMTAAGDAVSSGGPSYFGLASHAGLMYAHISLMVVGWVFVLPVGVMLSIAQSRLTLSVQLSFLVLNALGVIAGASYNRQTPDLYPNSAHHSLGWIVTWIVTAQAFVSLAGLYARRSKGYGGSTDERASLVPVSEEAMAEHRRTHPVPAHDYRFSNDSGQGTEVDSTPQSNSGISTEEHENGQLPDPARFQDKEGYFDEAEDDMEKWRFLRKTAIDRFLARKLPGFLPKRVLRPLQSLSGVVDRIILFLGFATLATGVVTYGGIFQGNDIFNGLAHFIKGGIFFWYGLITLGRWMGCFADLGWAWNVKPFQGAVGQRRFVMPSAEFVESFVIFFYGSTNVFLEHLAAWGQEWSAQDLEHVSISIMFLGGGLCGMLVESRKIRDFLNTGILTLKPAHLNHISFQSEIRSQADIGWEVPKSYNTSLNPLPGLIILLLGIMMSSHHQDSMISTMVHKQWGTLLVGFSLARAVTYILSYLSPPTSHFPSRPPSELIAAFCLISGGLVFMASNRNTVQAMEAHDLDAMFVFTVVMGFTAFLMAWEMVVIAVKSWAVRREHTRMFPIQPIA